MKRILDFSIALLVVAAMVSGANAEMIISYDSGLEPGPGSGAANPTNQNWTYDKNAENAYLGGYDSGIGGWRTVDGTSGGYANYSYNFTTDDQNAMDNFGWKATWTASMDPNAEGIDGSFVEDFYLPPHQDRQNDAGVWIERQDYSYILYLKADEEGNLQIDDGTTLHQITSGGGNSGYDKFLTYELLYDGNSATLSVNGTEYDISASSSTGRDVTFFGAHSSAGTGSVIWNECQIEAIPEPAGLGLLIFAAFFGFFRARLWPAMKNAFTADNRE